MEFGAVTRFWNFGNWTLDTGYPHRPFHSWEIAQRNAEEHFQI
jgi:hypothetical protein